MTKLLFFAAVWLGLSASVSIACEGRTACDLGDRSYHVRAPDQWDGASPLPVLLHFHGWGRQGSLIVGHGRIAIAFSNGQHLSNALRRAHNIGWVDGFVC